MPQSATLRRAHAAAAAAMLTTCLLGRAGAQQPGHAAHADSARDSSFAAMQQRGKVVMGVDQYTSVHRFDALADGGRIELQRDVDDSAGVRTIRAHLRAIASAFHAGDFSAPAMVHMREVPGTRVMAGKRAAIRYTVRDLPRGAELVMKSSDRDAIAAIHEFMAFQRSDHRAGGESDPMHGMHAMHGTHGMHGTPDQPQSARPPASPKPRR